MSWQQVLGSHWFPFLLLVPLIMKPPPNYSFIPLQFLVQLPSLALKCSRSDLHRRADFTSPSYSVLPCLRDFTVTASTLFLFLSPIPTPHHPRARILVPVPGLGDLRDTHRTVLSPPLPPDGKCSSRGEVPGLWSSLIPSMHWFLRTIVCSVRFSSIVLQICAHGSEYMMNKILFSS